MSNQQISVSATIQADLKKVWNHYTNPDHIINWNFADNSWQCPSATNDLRIGGKFLSRMEAKDGSMGFDFEGIYYEMEIGKKFAYAMTDGRKATVTFKNLNHQTEVLIAFDAEQENSIELQKEGWQAILNNFKAYAESH